MNIDFKPIGLFKKSTYSGSKKKKVEKINQSSNKPDYKQEQESKADQLLKTINTEDNGSSTFDTMA